MTKTIRSAFFLLTLLQGVVCAQQPNIVFMVVDDAGFADFGFMGSSEIPYPKSRRASQPPV